MTQITNAAADPALATAPTSAPEPAPQATPDRAAAKPAQAEAAPTTAGPDPADLRLVIEDDQAAGCFVYKTIDWRTGAVVQQLPREQLLKLREADGYLAGDVIKTQA
jgi:flagellar protein FlaG